MYFAHRWPILVGATGSGSDFPGTRAKCNLKASGAAPLLALIVLEDGATPPTPPRTASQQREYFGRRQEADIGAGRGE